jgi:hypothetical protein
MLRFLTFGSQGEKDTVFEDTPGICEVALEARWESFFGRLGFGGCGFVGGGGVFLCGVVRRRGAGRWLGVRSGLGLLE